MRRRKGVGNGDGKREAIDQCEESVIGLVSGMSIGLVMRSIEVKGLHSSFRDALQDTKSERTLLLMAGFRARYATLQRSGTSLSKGGCGQREARRGMWGMTVKS